MTKKRKKERKGSAQHLPFIALLLMAVLLIGTTAVFGEEEEIISSEEEIVVSSEEETDISQEEVGTSPEVQDGVYQLASAEDLIWFSNYVNGAYTDTLGDGTGASGELTNDIDLKEEAFVPIGNTYSNAYKGTFDGQGYFIHNLYISGADSAAGLFGYVNGASIQGILVDGEIQGSSIALGGIVGKSTGKTTISSCGNYANVTNAGSSGAAAGILANGDNGTIVDACFNRGQITAVERASGIAAEMSLSTIQNCYNAGDIYAKRAGGIGNGRSATFANCYNIGMISGPEDKEFACSIAHASYGEYENCYYLKNCAPDELEVAGVGMSKTAMKEASFVSELGNDNWKSAGEGKFVYPVLSWEKEENIPEAGVDDDIDAEEDSAAVPKPTGLVWNKTSKIGTWKKAEDVDLYLVTLYCDEEQVATYEIFKDMMDDDEEEMVFYFVNSIREEGSYRFGVIAGKENLEEGSENEGEILYSEESMSDTSYYDGIDQEVVKISSASDWLEIVNITCQGTEYKTDADAQNAAWSRRYELTADLDFSDIKLKQNQTKSWGNINAMFQGTFEGNGHKITGLTLSDQEEGLFAYIGVAGVVRDLVIDKPNVLFSDNAATACFYNYGTMENIGVVNANITADIGGIIGGMVSRNYGTITACYVDGGTLTANSSTSNGHAGFVGNNFGKISNSYSTMTVKTKSYCAGGFAGWADESGGRVGSFENCFATGDVSAAKGWSGGFIGRVNSADVTFVNCYAAGSVTSSGKAERAYGFTGSLSGEASRDIVGESAFDEEIPPENFQNCYYSIDQTATDNPKSGAQGMTNTQMKTISFADALGTAWRFDENVNKGYPILTGVTVPAEYQTEKINVELAIGLYDTASYSFSHYGEAMEISVDSTGNTRVIDVLEAAKEQGLLTYEYSVSPLYGSFIESINGCALTSPDGWMFTINDQLSEVSVSLATVKDGDQILWYQGMTQNLFLPPCWSELVEGSTANTWINISTAKQLEALTEPDADLTANYRLTRDIDAAGVEFLGIGDRDHPFQGRFHGQGHKIANLTINRPDEHNVGMFNFIQGAQIQDVTLENVYIRGLYSVGGLIGVADVYLDGDDRSGCRGNIIGSCHVTGTVIATNTDTSAVSTGAYVGGLVGFNNGDADAETSVSIYSSIDRCSSSCHVIAESFYSGGFAGGNYGYITNSTARGAVDGNRFSGGFLGGNEGSVYDCGAYGAVSGEGYLGGFAGTSGGILRGCYATGDVSGSGDQVGGFLGSAYGTVKNCSSAGTISTESSYAGAFAGKYSGTYVGLDKDITFQNNIGWGKDRNEKSLPAIGNKTTSTVESELAVIMETVTEDREALAAAFLDKHGVKLDAEDDEEEMTLQPEEFGRKVYEALVSHQIAEDAEITDQTPWILCDIAVYEKITGVSGGITDSFRESYLDHVVAAVQNDAGVTELAKYILSLRSLGYNPEKITFADGEHYNLLWGLKSKLKAGDTEQTNLYRQPYILLALCQAEETDVKAEAKTLMDNMMSSFSQSTGPWGSADAAGPMVTALAYGSEIFSYDGAASVIQEAVNEENIEGWLDENGAATYMGNASAESTAALIVALTAASEDPAHYTKNEKSLWDGLLFFKNADGDGLLHNAAGTGDPWMATEQGMRAVNAYLQYQKSEKKQSRIYDYRSIAMTQTQTTLSWVDLGETYDDTKGSDDSGNGGKTDNKITKKLKKTYLKQVKKVKGKKIKITWKKVKKAKGYEIRVSRSKKFTKAKTLTVNPGKTKGSTKLSYNKKKLKNGKRLYVQIRYKQVVNGKTVYSPWSKTKSVRVK